MANCNTVTFTASDGMKVAFPLDFLIERGAIVADKINSENIMDVMGCSNQLWIPGFPAKYFIRDIVAIDFTREAEAPASPTFEPTRDAYVNQPSIALR